MDWTDLLLWIMLSVCFSLVYWYFKIYYFDDAKGHKV